MSTRASISPQANAEQPRGSPNDRFGLYAVFLVTGLAAFMVVTAAPAEAACLDAGSSTTYLCHELPLVWNDISTTGTPVSLSDDVMSGTVPIGFAFSFYGNSYTNAYISSNGFLAFTSGQTSGCCQGQSVPNPQAPNNLIAGAWTDLYPPAGGSIRYETVGSAPTRMFIVQWTDIAEFGNSNYRSTFQIVLFEGSPSFEVRVDHIGVYSHTYTVGVEDQAGTQGVRARHGTQALSDVRFRFGDPVAPEAPVLQATAGPGRGEISLAWPAPSDGGSAITAYAIHRDGSPLATIGTNRSFVDATLADGTLASYQVSATNGVGEGPLSTAVAATTFTVPAAPSLTATPGIRAITLTWTAPADGGTAITGYMLHHGADLLASIPAANTSFVDATLANDESRSYTLRAENLVGEGPASTPASATTPTIPTMITAPRAYRDAGDHPGVSWSAPVSDGGLPITSYTVDACGEWANTTQTAYTSVSVPPTTYACAYSVRANNDVGSGPNFHYGSATAPTDLTAEAGPGRGQMTLTWTPPASAGNYDNATITQYLLIFPTGYVIPAGTASSSVVSGLADNADVAFTLRARNHLANGVAASTSATTLSFAPDAPTGLAFSNSAGQINLIWTTPARDGGHPITNYAIHRDGVELATIGTNLTFVDAAASTGNGGSRTYFVKAVTDFGTSNASNSVTVTPFAPPRTTLHYDEPFYNGWMHANPLITLTCTPAPGDTCVSVTYEWNDGPTQTYTGPFHSPGGFSRLYYRSTAAEGGAHQDYTHSFAVDHNPPSIDFASTCPAGGFCRDATYRAFGNESGTPVHVNDFSEGLAGTGSAAATWDADATIGTSSTGQKFLGEYAGGTRTLTLSGLPAHHMLSIEYDLLVFGSWEGENATLGPDRIRVTVDNGSALETSFATVPGQTQCYPRMCWAAWPALSGVQATGLDGLDAHIVRISQAFYHVGPSATIEFETTLDQGIADEAWGMDNLRIIPDESGIVQPSATCHLNGIEATCGGYTALEGMHTLTATARDTSNYIQTASLNFTIDRTAPLVWVNATCTNASGEWCSANEPGALGYTMEMSDALSPVAASCMLDGNAVECAGSTSVDGPHTFSITATDAAGNNATLSLARSLDATPPIATASRSPAANANGWNAEDVTVSFTCTDGGSGTSDIPSQTVSTEGAGQSVTGTCTDNVGNEGSVTLGNINIDKTTPATGITMACATQGNSSWCRSTSVAPEATATDLHLDTVDCMVDDVAASCTDAVSVQGEHIFAIRATDLAGNVGASSLAFRIDSVAPDLTATRAPPNPNGWYNAAVSVDHNCTDATSGVLSVSPTYTFSEEGAGQASAGSCTDIAGWMSVVETTGVNIDLSPPVFAAYADLAFPANSADGATVDYAVPAPADALSGIESSSCAPAPGSFFAMGATTVTCTAADRAGNFASMAFTLTVIPDDLHRIMVSGLDTMVAGTSWTYTLEGFDQHNNSVPLAQPTINHTAPRTTGSYTLTYTEQGITGSLPVDVVADALAGIVLSGPTTVVVDSTHEYALAGFDRYDNSVLLAQPSTTFHAPTSVGMTSVVYSEGGIDGSLAVEAIAASLARIDIAGPDTLVAGTSSGYDLAGFDAYGNPVGLATSSLVFEAPTTVGTTTVVHTEQGISGVHEVLVVPDELASITLAGPDTLVAGSSVQYALAGFDQYGNGVELPQTVLDHTAPTLTGPSSVSYTHAGITGARDVMVVADALASITVSGPATLVAGSSAEYALAGFDQYGNAVSLGQPSFVYEAPSSIGSYAASYTEQGVTGSQSVEVVSAPLARIDVDGPAIMVAGTSGEYAIAGFDQYGNPVALAASMFSYAAPTLVGGYVASYTESGITGSASVDVVPDVLASIVVTGPAEIVAGTTRSYALAGFDQYNNSVPLAQSTTDHTAPQTVGSYAVTYTEQGVTGSLLVTVIADGLHHITLTGPATLVAGTSWSYTLTGFDQYENSVGLAEPTLNVTAPTTAGFFTRSYTEGDVTGSKTIESVHDRLVRIGVTGPDTLVAGSTASYALAGFDQYDNGVELPQTVLDHTAPTVVGSSSVSYTHAGVTGTRDVLVVADALASITVSGPATLVAGSSAEYALAGFDQYGNAVDLAQTLLAYEASSAIGSYVVSYMEQGVTGSQPVEVVSAPLARIDLSGPAILVAGTSGEYAVAGFDQYGNPVALAAPSFAYSAPTLVGSYVASYTESGVTGSALVDVVPDVLASILVTGPADIVAGTTRSYALAGFDQYNNSAPLAQTTTDYTAPQTVGSYAVTYTEQGVTGSHPVTVIADVLHHITVTGPATLVSGTSWSYALAGFDQYDNAVGLAQPSLNVTAPTTAGFFTRSYTENGVTGSKTIESVHDRLVRIRVTGPDTLAAGSTASYALAGFDRYDNPVPLARLSTDYTAPTSPGAYVVRYTESGVTGSRNVQVIAAALHHITVSGAQDVVAGHSYTYGLAGFDAYENPVALAQNTIAYTAPTTAGIASVSYTERNVTGTKTVTVGPDALARITLAGPGSLVAGTSARYDAAGFDQYDNAVALQPDHVDYLAPTAVGTYSVTMTQQGVTGTLPVDVVADALASIVLTGPTTVVADSTHDYALAGFDQYGNSVSLAQVSTTFHAPTSVGMTSVQYSESGIDGALAVQVVAAGLARIDVTGPDTLVAGTTQSYGLAGVDAYENPVTLARSSLDFEAPTTAGPSSVSYTEQGVTGAHGVLVVADELVSITLTGPNTLVAGTSAQYALAGFDQYGNSVELPQTSLDHTATTLAGPSSVSYTHDGITGTHGLMVIADALASITVTGPEMLVAGSSGEYALAGFDQYGNAVTLAQASLTYQAPAEIGSYLVSYAEQGVTGTQAVEVVSASLARIDVSGPAVLVAGTSGEFAIAGFDQFSNPVALAAPTFSYTAPTLVGGYVASYTESGITGSASVDVIADVLASILVSGPAEIVAGTTQSYALAGYDQYGNDVVLDAMTADHTAPTLVGTTTVVYGEDDIVGTLDVTVIPDALATIDVAGPATMVANTTANFSVEGFDQYGNAVDLASGAFGFTAPTLVGPATASYSEAGVTGNAPVEVIADILETIVVSGPSPVHAGYEHTYALAGFDQYGNSVPLSNTTKVFAAPHLPGTYTVSYAENDVTGMLAVQVVLPPVHHVTVTPAVATINVDRTLQLGAVAYDDNGNRIVHAPIAWSSDNGTITQAGAFRMGAPGNVTVTATSAGTTGTASVTVSNELLVNVTLRKVDIAPLGHALRGTVIVRFLDGTPVAGANVTVTLHHNKAAVGTVNDETQNGTTDASGQYQFTMIPLFAAPGEYTATAVAEWSGNAGEGEATFTASALPFASTMQVSTPVVRSNIKKEAIQ